MKWYIIMCLLVGGAFYLVDMGGEKDPVQDLISYSMKNYSPEWTPKVRYYGATYHFHRGNWTKAQKIYTELLLDYPTHPFSGTAFFRLGMSAEEARDWAMSKAAFKRFLDQFPKHEDREFALKKLEMLKYQKGEDVPEFPTKEEYYPPQ